jgi:hypothetical protein
MRSFSAYLHPRECQGRQLYVTPVDGSLSPVRRGSRCNTRRTGARHEYIQIPRCMESFVISIPEHHLPTHLLARRSKLHRRDLSHLSDVIVSGSEILSADFGYELMLHNFGRINFDLAIQEPIYRLVYPFKQEIADDLARAMLVSRTTMRRNGLRKSDQNNNPIYVSMFNFNDIRGHLISIGFADAHKAMWDDIEQSFATLIDDHHRRLGFAKTWPDRKAVVKAAVQKHLGAFLDLETFALEERQV